MKIKEIGEFGLIDLITKKSKNKDVLVDIGDDAAVIKAKGLEVLTTDTLVEGDHFRKEWFSPEQIGKKAIEINVSDVAAMGGTPKYVLVSLALPSNIDVSFVKRIYLGMWKSCKKYKLDIIGGNMTHCDTIVISITLIGNVLKQNLTLRSQAKPNDLIYVSGSLGFGRAGLRLFQEKIDGFDKIKERYLEPKAQLEYAEKIRSSVNSMIDISDGLAPEIRHICEQSNCGAIVYKDKIPIGKEVKKIAKKLNEDEYDYALYGGEDFQLLFTVSKKNASKTNGILIGRITKSKEIKLLTDKKEIILNKKGYDHFSNNL
jgi:thiamine-monophosphate kinase